jgi:hypothetical protein
LNGSGHGDDTKGDIMSIIDAGHERGVIVPRLVPLANGKDWKTARMTPTGLSPRRSRHF